jgi:hypothetical protein
MEVMAVRVAQAGSVATPEPCAGSATQAPTVTAGPVGGAVMPETPETADAV